MALIGGQAQAQAHGPHSVNTCLCTPAVVAVVMAAPLLLLPSSLPQVNAEVRFLLARLDFTGFYKEQ